MAFIIGLLKKWQKKEIKRTFYNYGENPEFPNSNPIKRALFFFGTYSKNMPNSALLEYFIEHKPPPIVLYPKATYFGTFLIFENKKNSKC